MKLLELFSGTGSVGKVAKTLGWEVVSLGLKNADIYEDIHGIIRNMNLTILIWFGRRRLAQNIVWLKLQLLEIFLKQTKL